MSKTQTWRQRLLVAAELRGIKFDAHALETIRSAEDHGPLAKWVELNIGPDQILTEDELSIWRHCEKTSKDTLARDEVDVTSIPSDDVGFRDSINALEASTKAITSQIRALEKQRSIMAAYEARHAVTNTASDFEAALERQQQAETQQLNFLTVDVLADLEAKLGILQERAEKSVRSVPSIVNERLRADDRTIGELEQSISESDERSHAFDVPYQQKRVEDLLSALQRATVVSVKDRLDRVYLEALQSETEGQAESGSRNVSQGSEDDQDQVHLAQDDLQSLYSEIDDVAAMLIQHEHGRPLQSILRTIEKDQRESDRLQKRMALSQLTDLTDGLNDLATRYEHLHSHCTIMNQLQATLNDIQEQQRHHQQNQKSNSISNRREKTFLETPALDALLQHLDIDKNIINNEPASSSSSPYIANNKGRPANPTESVRDTQIRSPFTRPRMPSASSTEKINLTSAAVIASRSASASASTSDLLSQIRHLALSTSQSQLKHLQDLYLQPSSHSLSSPSLSPSPSPSLASSALDPATFFKSDIQRLEQLDDAIAKTKREVEHVIAASTSAPTSTPGTASFNANTAGKDDGTENESRSDFLTELKKSEDARRKFVNRWEQR